ncbi:MAG: hypothetical protein E7679_05340 [Ruminococcaceae bacterium]|nr:hypothetical protein [Oscillospiraceae bacterium]
MAMGGKMKKTVFFLVAMLLISTMLFSCGDKDNIPGETSADNAQSLRRPDISQLELSEYITLGNYSGLVIVCGSESERGNAVWDKVVADAEVKKYPEEQVNYYFFQSKAKYEYLAKNGNDSYENIIAALGVTEEQMLEDARALVKEDLCFYAIIKAEGISLSKEEKSKNFDRYVKKYTEAYGYSESYARENMKEQIYESMLFDKMLEKLIILNEFNIEN